MARKRRYSRAAMISAGLAAVVNTAGAAVADEDQAPRFRLILLERVGDYDEPYDLNNRGEVVGASHNDMGTQAAGVVWRAGKAMPLPRLPGRTEAFSINDAGTIAGYTSVAGSCCGQQQLPALWTGDKLRLLADEPAAGAAGYAVNDLNQVVGQQQAGRPAVWDRGTWSDIPAATEAWSITNRGLISGVTTASDGTSVATVWDRSGQRSLEPPPAGYSRAVSANDRGQAVGSLSDDGRQAGLLWQAEGSVMHLDTGRWDEAIPTDINNGGVIVGFAHGPASGVDREVRAVAWVDGRITALPLPEGWAGGSAAWAINDIGQIAGVVHKEPGLYTGNPGRAVVWAPTSPALVATP